MAAKAPGGTPLGPPLRVRRTACHLHAVGGSLVTDFEGDAIVNAANEGCVTGFGVDGAINKAGGLELIRARRELGGCPTGQARITPSFGLDHRVEHIVHAVGPVYRRNRHKLSEGDCDDDRERDWAAKDELLASAYWSALRLASDAECKTVGLCLLSAGVFRGERPLDDVIRLAVESLLSAAPPAMGEIESLYLFAYALEERAALEKIVLEKHKERE